MLESEHAPASTTSQRVERKYPLPEAMLNAAIAELGKVLPVYHYNGSHDWSSIRTIYLDTGDLQCYQEYEQNLPVRRKIRIRQYGVNGRFDDVCWIELKVKNRNLSMKRRFRCLTGDLADLLAGRDIRKRIADQNEVDVGQVYDMIRSLMLDQRLRPVVRLDYERLSFQPVNSNGLRLTLDRDVRFCSACMTHEGPLEGLIVEVKHHGTKPTWFPSLREQLGLRRARRFSKFARSMKQIGLLRESEAPR